jgi:tetratricopeptide (TPR) repeat protein
MLLSLSCANQDNKKMPITTSSDLAMEYYETGIKAYEQIKWADAIDNLKKAVEVDPDFFMAYYWLFPLSGEFSKDVAEKALNIDVKLSPGEQILKTAFKYIVDGQQEKALEQVEKLIKMYPEDVQAYKIKYLLQFQFYKDIESARKTIEEAIKVQPDHAISYNMLGYALMDLEDYDGAEKAFDKYIELEPNIANPYDSKGDFFMKLDRYQEAYDSYMKAYRIDSTFTISYKKALKAKELMGNLESA